MNTLCPSSHTDPQAPCGVSLQHASLAAAPPLRRLAQLRHICRPLIKGRGNYTHFHVIDHCAAALQGIPPMLLPYLRLSYTSDPDMLHRPGFFNAGPSSDYSEKLALAQLTEYLQQRLSKCVLSGCSPPPLPLPTPRAVPRPNMKVDGCSTSCTIVNQCKLDVHMS